MGFAFSKYLFNVYNVICVITQVEHQLFSIHIIKAYGTILGDMIIENRIVITTLVVSTVPMYCLRNN